MVWTDEHDILLCREILAKNPLYSRKVHLNVGKHGKKLEETYHIFESQTSKLIWINVLFVNDTSFCRARFAKR